MLNRIDFDARLQKLIQASLAEDIGARDLTSTLLPPRHTSKADCIFKEEAVLCGITIAEHIFRLVDDELRFLPVAKDGEVIEVGRAIFYVEGSTRSILAAPRRRSTPVSYTPSGDRRRS